MNNLSKKPKKPKIVLVTGASGQLASELKSLVLNKDLLGSDFDLFWKFIFADKEILDITNTNLVKEFFEKNKIDFCINCAAYTQVDQAEIKKDLALMVNVEATSTLAKNCFMNQAILIQISTDYVFDGKSCKPYLETDETQPINFYGETKLQGEKLALQQNPNTIIIRTSWLYSKIYGKNFYKTILNLAQKKDKLEVIVDQVGTPTNCLDLAQAIFKILLETDFKTFAEFGIYNFSNQGVASWYDFAYEIVKNNKLKCEIVAINSINYPTIAKRPNFSVLDKNKIERVFGIKVANWRESLSS